MTLAVSANNGTAPASALSPMPGRNGNGSQQMSPTATVDSYGRIRHAMVGAGLGDLLPSDGWSCYRDRAAQQHMRDIGMTTIPVGQSIHGEWSNGGAVDFANLGGFGGSRHAWLRANGGAHGWYQPRWAQQGGSLPEPWHWEHDSRNDQHAGEGTGFLMTLTDQQQAELFSLVQNIAGWTYRGGPDVNAGQADPGSIASRTIHVDQVVAGAQATPGNALGRIMNIDRQVTGADDFGGSVAERVINIEDATVTDEPTTAHAAVWSAVVALVIAFATAAGLVVADVTHNPDEGLISGGTALVGGLLGWLAGAIKDRRSGHDG